MRLFFILLLSLISAHLSACNKQEHEQQPSKLIVFAAASTCETMHMTAERFEDKTGTRVVLSCDASSRLARQIIAGAPADVFISANQQWMDEVATANSFASQTRRDLIANELVIIAPENTAIQIDFEVQESFVKAAPSISRIAIGDPIHVPAGMYAKQALVALGWWDDIEPRVIPAGDVRAALRLVQLGEADLGIVYATDAAHALKIRIIAAIQSHLHDPIHYPVAQCSASHAGAQFIDFLHSDDMRDVFREAGFRIVAATEDQSP